MLISVTCIGNLAEAAMFSSSEKNTVEEWIDSYGGIVRVYGLLGTVSNSRIIASEG